MTITRRDAMRRGGGAVVATAVLSIVPPPGKRADTALLDLERRWYLAFARKRKWREAAWQAIDDLPPGQRYVPGSPFVSETLHIKELRNLEAQAEHEMRVIEDRMTETPAQTIAGIAAKLRVEPGWEKAPVFKRSILADAERLAGRTV